MPSATLWKYFTKEHHRELVLQYRLLGDTHLLPDEQLRRLYAVSRHAQRHYTRHTIAKRDGTTRELLEPDRLLKMIQRNILHRVLAEQPVSPHATAYRQSGCVRDNAMPHLRQPQVLKLDIQDFFGSITYLMVYRLAFPRIYFPPSVATLLAHLCCYNDYLPQGAPTSAAISNLALKPFDGAMGEWCAQRGIAYTRYCDDMAFSGNFDARAVVNKVRSFLLSMGFLLREDKTQLLHAGSRQVVTGVVVNDHPQVSRVERDKLRQELYYVQRYGVASHLERTSGGAPPAEEEQQRYLHALLGRVSYVLQVDPANRHFAKAKQMLLNRGEGTQT